MSVSKIAHTSHTHGITGAAVHDGGYVLSSNRILHGRLGILDAQSITGQFLTLPFKIQKVP